VVYCSEDILLREEMSLVQRPATLGNRGGKASSRRKDAARLWNVKCRINVAFCVDPTCPSWSLGVRQVELGRPSPKDCRPLQRGKVLCESSSSDQQKQAGSVFDGNIYDEINHLKRMIAAQSVTIEKQQQMIAELQDRPGLGKPTVERSPVIEELTEQDRSARRNMHDAAINDRRLVGMFDARYHSASSGATPKDHRILPRRIVLVRHAESEGNVNNQAYTYLPDPQVPLTSKGWRQALEAGNEIKDIVGDSKLFFYTSPYLRSKQTYDGVAEAFGPSRIAGVQEEVQLREQDFGNFQDAEGKRREKAERLRFGRFFYRFPNGESGADVYDRMTLFEDHLVRDINAGRFSGNSSLILVTHGLALRIFLMRWFHWTVDQFMGVYNPPNAVPLVLERIVPEESTRPGGPATWIHTKALYRLSAESMSVLEGCTPDMCTTSVVPRGFTEKRGKEESMEGPPKEVHEFLETLDGEEELRPPRKC